MGLKKDSQSIDNLEGMPYKPSWIDHFTKLIETMPVPAWGFYAALGLFLILVQILFLWLEGGLHAQELLPVILFNGLAIPFLLAVIQLLDNQALSAVDSMQPMLDLTVDEIEQYKYRLSTMPFLRPLLAGAGLTAAVILIEQVSAPLVRYAVLEELPVFTVVYYLIDKSSAFLFGVVIYHTIRQLRLVDSINSNHVQIKLFHLGPLQSFSRLTASTSLALVVFIYVWIVLNPELLTDPLLFAIVVVFTILAVSIFVWPLWGIHRLMEIEKVSALHEIDLQFEAVFNKLNQHISDEDYDTIDRLNRTIASLEIQYQRINAIPTWPWKSETARLVLTAIALPIMLMIIQYFVLQALNR